MIASRHFTEVRGRNHAMWMLGINGLIVDVRRCTREVQEAAFEKGMIPYIPADRAAHGGTE